MILNPPALWNIRVAIVLFWFCFIEFQKKLEKKIPPGKHSINVDTPMRYTKGQFPATTVQRNRDGKQDRDIIIYPANERLKADNN